MAGITDAPMRRICREQGASLCYTEMVSSKGLYYGDKKTGKLLFMYEDEQPCAVQIFGHEPDIMAFAAEKLEELPNPILDINMGCPVPKVFKNGDGSALSKDPELAEKVVAACVKATSKPVTAKIRLGIDEDSINVVEMAKAIEAGGASAVTVHARTREAFYSGEASWSWIKKVKENVSIPVIGNGDVRSADDAKRLMAETGCDLVMVARAALGNPWIFRELREGISPVSLDERKEMMLRQFSEMCALKGEYAAVREMRKIVGWYIKGFPGSAKLRAVINRIDDPDELRESIKAL